MEAKELISSYMAENSSQTEIKFNHNFKSKLTFSHHDENNNAPFPIKTDKWLWKQTTTEMYGFSLRLDAKLGNNYEKVRRNRFFTQPLSTFNSISRLPSLTKTTKKGIPLAK